MAVPSARRSGIKDRNRRNPKRTTGNCLNCRISSQQCAEFRVRMTAEPPFVHKFAALCCITVRFGWKGRRASESTLGLAGSSTARQPKQRLTYLLSFNGDGVVHDHL